jgi:alpha-L-fucosidase 2
MRSVMSWRQLFSVLLVAATISMTNSGTSSATAAGLESPERGFISSQPGKTWEEGLISGNGTLGTCMLSQPLDDTIVFTHERIFLPKFAPIMPPKMGPRLFEIRRLIDRGLYHQATQLAFDLSDQEGFIYPDPFVPAFDLRIRTKDAGETKDYMRSVDFRTGVCTVRFAADDRVYRRRLFVSRADGVAVLELTAPSSGSLNCRLTLRPRTLTDAVPEKTVERSNEVFNEHVSDVQVKAEGSSITWFNRYPNAYPGSIQTLEGIATVANEGGAVTPEGDSLEVAGSKKLLVIVDVEPCYEPTHSNFDAMKQAIADLPKDFDTLLKPHAKLHGELFNRMELKIGGGDDHKLTTEELLADSTNDDLNAALIEKQFDAGRYNIICCTGELPPTLQGVWGGTYVPNWASDYTHNGNVPSAIASLMMGNTPELMLAYTSYIESIVPYLEINARRMFGARGVVLPSRSTTNGFNNALNARFAGGFWVGGAAWAAHFFYDYYLYTGDREFLAEHALPFMEKAAVFFEDYLYEGPDGKYIFSPTQSPENSPPNTKSQGTFNATMDIAAAKELLRNTIAASRELGVNGDRVPKWESMLDKMPEYMISEEGAIKEWLTPKLHDSLNHRHSSQLYALYDGMPEEIANNPKIRNAFKTLIEVKLDKHWKEKSSGFMSFGLVQLGQAATSLGEGEIAYECLKSLVNRYWLSNLASMHNHKSLFNMDISGGMPCVIIKMLVASDPGRIQLLPAAPKEWTSGRIDGALCRGQIEIRSLSWNPKGITAKILSGKNQSVLVGAPWDVREAVLSGDLGTLQPTDARNVVRVILPAGKVVTLHFEK